LLRRDAAPSTGTRFEIRSALSLSAFVDALNELPEIVEHHEGRYLDRARSRSLDLIADGAEVNLRLVSLAPETWQRGAPPPYVLVRLVGRVEVADNIAVFSGRIVTRMNFEITWQDRIAPRVAVIGLIALFALAPFSEVAGAAAGAVAVSSAWLYFMAWGTIRAIRPARIVEAARLLGTVGATTQGLVTVEPRRVNLALRPLEPVLMDVPGPLVSRAIDRLASGHATSVTTPHGPTRNLLAEARSQPIEGNATARPANNVDRPVAAPSPEASQAREPWRTAGVRLARAAVPVLIVTALLITRLGPQPGWWAAGSVGYQPRIFLGLAVLGAAGLVTFFFSGTPTQPRRVILLAAWVAELAIAVAAYNEALYKAVAGSAASLGLLIGLLIGLLACWSMMTAFMASLWAIRTSVRH
jgi:hypothetical protein